MRYYTVHIPSGLNQGLPAEDTPRHARQVLGAALFVREGFSWLAFFFSIPWAIANGLWFAVLAMSAALAVIIGLPEIFSLDWASCTVLLIGYALFCGFNGNDWRRLGLEQSDWDVLSVIVARDRGHALIRFAHQLSNDVEDESDVSAAKVPGLSSIGPRLDFGPSPGFWS